MIIDKGSQEVGGFKRTPYGKRKRGKKQYATVDNLEVFSVIHESAPVATQPDPEPQVVVENTQPEEMEIQTPTDKTVEEFVDDLINHGFTSNHVRLIKTTAEYERFKGEPLKSLEKNMHLYFTTLPSLIRFSIGGEADRSIQIKVKNIEEGFFSIDVIRKEEKEMSSVKIGDGEGVEDTQVKEEKAETKVFDFKPSFWQTDKGLDLKFLAKNVGIAAGIAVGGYFIYKKYVAK